MMRSSLHKRLDAVEDSIGDGFFVVIYKGLPPYYVLEQKPENRGEITEPLLMDNPEVLEAYINSLPRSAKVVQLLVGEDEPTVLSSEIYQWGQ